MGNPEHEAKLTEGVEAWNAWRVRERDVVPDLSYEIFSKMQLEGADFQVVQLKCADFVGAQLKGANFQFAQLKGAHFMGSQLDRANFVAAQLKGADFTEAQLDRANFRDAQLKGVRLHSANLSNADLRNAKGIRFNDTKILHARLTARPGNFFQRLLNPLFILNPVTDPWSELRRAYTGPNFIITLIVLLLFLLPYVFRAAVWQGINLAQSLLQTATENVQEAYMALQDQSAIPLPADFKAAVEGVLSLEPCFAVQCEPYQIWQILLGVNRGWDIVALTVVILLYNALRYYLTQTVSAYREEEERSGYTPSWRGDLSPARVNRLMRYIREFLGGYQHLVWLHIALRILFFIAVFAFGVNLYDVLLLEVELPVTGVP